ncbi:carbohydrate sulfotransferase 11 isoform X1 [Bactrocera dorsalis]|uniref:Carbohydrate sulfotransferase n=1 Tax=Bactrocera dorsalis TaxID=27457 RepID=A0A034W387_BACDO|nr:carbohydrate sulfotransferase 11 isoform X1 [Bactrocera dorsalis]XP_049313312.1 carbohydrate sulfotransferase 11 isoform X1 [Bactrocera dorsalis]XP_049313314.1 carbohydrate sulfotransferase 11 isoform X1 [Bactrocera dorsalis]
MWINSPYWRAIRRCLFIFVAISLLPLALVYMVRLDQAYRLKGYEATKFNDHFGDQSFRYPVMLLGKNKDLTVAATGSSRKKFYKYAKYVNESHLPVLPEDAVHTLAPIDVERVEKRMERRRKLLQEKCTEFGLDVVGNDTWHKPNAWEFLVNKKYHIIWCNVFKAGSSSWMYNFNVLAGYSPEFLQRTKEVFLTLARERYPRFSIEKLREAQNDSITFMIARHPFERLLSAYRDKMVFAIPHSYHDKLGRRIVRKYRSKNLDMNSPRYPTFPEFVRWLLVQIKHGSVQIDMHFVSSTMFCTPCLINFDVIMKFDTLDEDQLYLINKTGLSRVIAPEWRNAGKGKNTQELLQSFYSKLSPRELQGLYQYYKYDFELFNYSAASYFNLVHENGT